MTGFEIQCLTVLQAAAASSIGLCVKTNDPYRARASLYRFRKEFGDPQLSGLQIRVSPTDSEGEIWIIRNVTVVTTSVDLLNA
jgi:hypothetical protein